MKGESKFRVGAAHPAHPVDKSLAVTLSDFTNLDYFLKSILSPSSFKYI
jgi:hypothetical protein